MRFFLSPFVVKPWPIIAVKHQVTIFLGDWSNRQMEFLGFIIRREQVGTPIFVRAGCVFIHIDIANTEIVAEFKDFRFDTHDTYFVWSPFTGRRAQVPE